MAYTRNWSTATALTPWTASIGADYSFDSGLQFDGNNTIIKKTGATYVSGTSTIYFSIDGVGASFPNSLQRFGVSVWGTDGKYLMGEIKSQIKNGDVNLWWGFCTIDTVSGSRGFTGSSSYDSGYTPGDVGTLELWHSGGTWYNKLTYESINLGTNAYDVGDYNPTSSSCDLAHYGYIMLGNTHFKVTSGTYTPTVVSTPIGRYFWYDGYYNNGSTQGQKDLTTSVLTVSPIQQYLYLPTMKGAFNSQVTVTLKNNNNQWGSFTGHATSGDSYNPSGVFYIRDAEVENGTETLFAGFLDYKTITVDALNQTVSIKLNSILSGLVDKPIVNPALINEDFNTTHSVTGLIGIDEVGTIISIEQDYEETSGTLVYYGVDAPSVHPNEILSNSSSYSLDNNTFRVDSWIGGGDGTGTFTTKNIPLWLNVDDILMRNSKYPSTLSSSVSAMVFWEDAFSTPLSFYNPEDNVGETGIDAWGGATLNWNIASSAMITALESVQLSPSKYLYGDETFIDVLNDFLIGVGGGGCSSYDGETINFFVPSPTYLLQDAQGTLDYETDIYGVFTAAKESPLKSVTVNYAWDVENRKYAESTRINTDFNYGEDKVISTWLINFNEDARNLAYFTSAYFSSGATVLVKTDTSHWNKQRPGGILEINNLPVSFEVNGSLFLVSSRVFDPATKLVTSLMQEVTLEAADFFRINVHKIGETTGVL